MTRVSDSILEHGVGFSPRRTGKARTGVRVGLLVMARRSLGKTSCRGRCSASPHASVPRRSPVVDLSLRFGAAVTSTTEASHHSSPRFACVAHCELLQHVWRSGSVSRGVAAG